MPRKKKENKTEVIVNQQTPLTEVFVDGHGDVREVVAKKKTKVIEGIYSTRVENPDGSLVSFVIDDDKLFQHVKDVLSDFEKEKKSSSRKTKKIS